MTKTEYSLTFYHALIWNSVSPGKRSLTDTFIENSIGTFVNNCRKAGFNVIVEDWANLSFYKDISPNALTRINRFLYKRLLFKRKQNILTKYTGSTASANQRLIEIYLNFTMHRRLKCVAKRIAREKIPFLVIKVRNGDAFKWSKELVKKVNKYCPETVTIAGGAHPSIYQEDFLRHSNFDLAVVSESEHTLLDILSITYNKKTKEDIIAAIKRAAEHELSNNLLYRDNGIIKRSVSENIETFNKEIPEYSYSNSKVKIHVLTDSPGCSCGKWYAGVHADFLKYHVMCPEKVIEEIKSMLKKGIGIFRFAGCCMNLTDAAKIAEKIIDNGLKIQYSIFGIKIPKAKSPARYTLLVNMYELLIKSGLRAVCIGAETGNDLILQEALGGHKISEDVLNTVKAVRDASRNTGIRVDVCLSFIYPVPAMGKVSADQIYEDNLKLAKAASPDSVICYPPVPLKGTDWFKKSSRYGFTIGEKYIPEMLVYEYEMYKPVSMWKDIDFTLDGISWLDILKKCNEMRNGFESAGFSTELTDEYFLLMRNTGYDNKKTIEIFKKETILDMVSGNYNFTNSIYYRVNKASELIAESNKIANYAAFPELNNKFA
ncbi:hypothetical protein AMJ80_01225 [bacterium SM23_31]|nr:MAG: hypothetical protein AMJ80_01225 [bacterium SM23_31]